VVHYAIEAAKAARRIADVWVLTDGEGIAEAAREAGARLIALPRSFSEATDAAAIHYALDHVGARLSEIDNVALLLGSTVYLDAGIVDLALGILEDRKDLDSVITVWEAGDDHPARALALTGEGLVGGFGGEPATGRAYYSDRSVCAFRARAARHPGGPAAQPWLGQRIHPIVRPWLSGRELRSPIDALFAEHWVQHPDAVRKLNEENH
jgi:N-acylneuraminate cytidylyltransferase